MGAEGWVLGRVRDGVREPAVAGIYYEADPERLRAQLQALFEGLNVGDGCRPRALLVPHAGYNYSGRVAAHAYAALAKSGTKPSRIVIVAPNHTGLGARVSVYPGKAFLTPLGQVSVDASFSRLLTASVQGAALDYYAHIYEHSVEVQLPMLQHIYNESPPPIVAVVMFNDERTAPLKIAEFLAEHTDDIVVVATSNLTQFKPYEKVRKLDSLLLDALKRLSIDALDKAVEEGANPCGLSVLRMFIEYAKRVNGRVEVLAYSTSVEAGSSRDLAVGYAALRVC